MDLDKVREAIEVKVFHMHPDSNIPLHRHDDKDEIFYCMHGNGFGVLENKEVNFNSRSPFVVPAGEMHTLRAAGDLYVTAVLIPTIREV